MGMAAILVKGPGPFEQTFVHPSQGENLASIGPVLTTSTRTPTNIRTTETYLHYKLTNEPKGSCELKKKKKKKKQHAWSIHWLYRRSRNSAVKTLGVDVIATSLTTTTFKMGDVNATC